MQSRVLTLVQPHLSHLISPSGTGYSLGEADSLLVAGLLGLAWVGLVASFQGLLPAGLSFRGLCRRAVVEGVALGVWTFVLAVCAFSVIDSAVPQQRLGVAFLIVQLGFASSLASLCDSKASKNLPVVRGVVALTGGWMALALVGRRARGLRPRFTDAWCGVGSAALWVLVGSRIEAHPWSVWAF